MTTVRIPTIVHPTRPPLRHMPRRAATLATHPVLAWEQDDVQAYVRDAVSMDEAMFFLDPLQRYGVGNPRAQFIGAYDEHTRLVGVLLRHGSECNVVWSAPAAAPRLAGVLRQSGQRVRLSGPAPRAEAFLRHFVDAELTHRQYGTTCVLTPSTVRAVALQPTRRATAADVEAILALEQRVLAHDQQQHLATTARREVISQRIASYSVWIAADETRAVAVAYTDVEISAAAHVCEVATDPAYRSQGFGTACVAALCQDLLRRVERVFLTYAHGNAPAARAYAKIGFHPWAARQRVSLALDAADAVQMAA